MRVETVFFSWFGVVLFVVLGVVSVDVLDGNSWSYREKSFVPVVAPGAVFGAVYFLYR